MTSQTSRKHFLDLSDFDAADLQSMLEIGSRVKRRELDLTSALAGKIVLMMFEMPSTRTRVSLETAVKQMGGSTVVLNPNDSQLGRGESVADTARVLSGFVDAIALRTHDHKTLATLAEYATVPVINLLSDWSHPVQLMADLMTMEERFDDISKLKVAWSGDGNNVLHSWMHATARFGFELAIACPSERMPDAKAIQWAKDIGAKVTISNDPQAAVKDADVVVTDVWVSMGDEAEGSALHNMLAPFRVDEPLMARANADAIFMHCLPAKRGQEVTDAVLDGPQSAAWDEAENRLHATKGILAWCMG
jgi:ornithine carbamoyltransferase